MTLAALPRARSLLVTFSLSLLVSCDVPIVEPSPSMGQEAIGKADGPSTQLCVESLTGLTRGPARAVRSYRLVIDRKTNSDPAVGIAVGPDDEIAQPQAFIGAQAAVEVTYLDGLATLAGDEPVVLAYHDSQGQIVRVPMITKPTFDAWSSTAPIEAPASGWLEVWFEREATDGTLRVDPEDGGVIALPVRPAPSATACFDGAFEEQLDQPLFAGTSLEIFYDTSRIEDQIEEDSPSILWDIDAVMMPVDANGEALAQRRARIASGRVIGQTEESVLNAVVPLDVPADAVTVEVWFEGRANDLPQVWYDSNEGQNYVFTIQR